MSRNVDTFTVTGPEQITHLLTPPNNRIAHISYIDSFIQEATRQGYTSEFICNKFDVIFVTQISAGMVVQQNSPLREVFNYK
jgi:hypothetical protein